jgi:1-aminocyclopropane-1-carboxylate deaminase/D-cysteine desulfhydrase-like pyridoxal-dependent ACC family enzyme
MACAAELVLQSKEQAVQFDYIVHCTGSGSTQAGLVAGFAFMGEKVKVIGVADDYETDIKRSRVLELANNALTELESSARVMSADIEIIAADQSVYGEAEPETIDVIRLLASCEGLVADPVYEGKALRGLQALAKEGRLEASNKVLLMHLGGTPAVHAYANQFELRVNGTDE